MASLVAMPDDSGWDDELLGMIRHLASDEVFETFSVEEQSRLRGVDPGRAAFEHHLAQMGDLYDLSGDAFDPFEPGGPAQWTEMIPPWFKDNWQHMSLQERQIVAILGDTLVALEREREQRKARRAAAVEKGKWDIEL